MALANAQHGHCHFFEWCTAIQLMNVMNVGRGSSGKPRFHGSYPMTDPYGIHGYNANIKGVY